MRALLLGSAPADGLAITHTVITAIRQAEESLRIAEVAFEYLGDYRTRRR